MANSRLRADMVCYKSVVLESRCDEHNVINIKQ
jgi:hypothetical protein